MRDTANEESGELNAHGEALEFFDLVVGDPEFFEGACDLFES